MTGTSGRREIDDWEEHWHAYGESAGRNPAQAFRQRLVLEALGPLPPDARIVDIGSGQGDLLAAVHAREPRAALLGVEQSAAGIELARGKVPTARFLDLDLIESGADGTDVGWATYGVCCEVIEHVDDPVLLLANAATFLAPGARLIVTVPGGPRSAYDRHLGHRRHFDEDSLRDVLVRSGLADVRIRRAGFPFFNLYKLLVIARGRRLIEDVDTRATGAVSRPAELVMRAFDHLLPLSMHDVRWGWQLVAVAAPMAP